jgi:hypothetical protein
MGAVFATRLRYMPAVHSFCLVTRVKTLTPRRSARCGSCATRATPSPAEAAKTVYTCSSPFGLENLDTPGAEELGFGFLINCALSRAKRGGWVVDYFLHPDAAISVLHMKSIRRCAEDIRNDSQLI